MKLYLDSSALIKRYIHENGSEKVLKWCARADRLILSVLSVPEAVSAFSRLKREGSLSEDLYRLVRDDFQEDLQEAAVVALEDAVIEKSVECLERHPLGTLDSIHLASAIVERCDLFLSADAQQRKAAQACGLKVEAV